MSAERAPHQPAKSFIQEQDFAARQYRGKREHQEDYYAYADATAGRETSLSRLLLSIGDGLGAHSGGMVASYVAVNAFVRAFLENDIALSWRLRLSLDAANDTIAFLGQRLPNVSTPMGTTLLSVCATMDQLYWISVGDSPLFLFRDGSLERLNEDHSLVPLIEQRVRIGEISQEEADRHPDRHTLQSALMGKDIYMIDAPSEAFPLKSGDIIIAASDGIFSMDSNHLEELLAFGKNSSADKIADAIIFAIRRMNLERQDNTTVGVIKVP